MKQVLYTILALMLTTSAYAMGDLGRHDNGHNGGHGHMQPPHYGGGHHPPHPHPHPPIYPPPYIPPYVPPYVPSNPAQVQVIHCGSVGYQPNRCYTSMRIIRRIDILRQYSHSPCIPGSSVFQQGNAILVTNGCEADFRVLGNY